MNTLKNYRKIVDKMKLVDIERLALDTKLTVTFVKLIIKKDGALDISVKTLDKIQEAIRNQVDYMNHYDQMKEFFDRIGVDYDEQASKGDWIIRVKNELVDGLSVADFVFCETSPEDAPASGYNYSHRFFSAVDCYELDLPH